MSRLPQYLAYHRASVAAGDVDPSYAMLLYVCDRYELNVEQRYWIAWLYAMCYAGATSFYWYNELPDYENVDVGRMTRWWFARGRESSLVQTDRRWVRSSNMLVPAFESYRVWLGGKSQREHFASFEAAYPGDLQARYDALYRSASQLYSFGQFALFLYLEALHVVTPTKLCPTDLDLDRAWSCRNGLYYAYGRDDLVEDEETRIRPGDHAVTDEMWRDLRSRLEQLETPPTVWQTETVLCAFRKYHRGKRYVGYYLDRQGGEIAKMGGSVTDGVFWDVLWQYRAETYEPLVLAEAHGCMGPRGVQREWREYREACTRHVLEEAIDE